MKYVIVIPDGCADDPQDDLGGKTPLQAARTPYMDAIAQTGVVGRSNNVPKPLTPASDVATLSLFGYDPLEVYTGRAPLETVAMGVKLGPDDWAIRCNLVHIKDGTMNDFTAGHITNEAGEQLIASLNEKLGGPTQSPLPPGMLEFHAGVSYRNVLVFRATEDQPAPFSAETKTQAPHDIPDQNIDEYSPQGPGAEVLTTLMEQSREIFADHPANHQRQAEGLKPATQVWLWGQGKAPQVEPFLQKYGKTGAIISGVDLVRGTGMLVGWQRIDVAGATGYLDTDYVAKGRAAIKALNNYDLVCVHIEAPDEASHEGRTDEKIKALESIDRDIVGPILQTLKSMSAYRILVTPDHRTTLSTRAHAYGDVPIAVCGTGVSPRGQMTYDEMVAAKSDLAFERGYEMMNWFLG